MKINLLKNANSGKTSVRKMLRELMNEFSVAYDIVEKEAAFYAHSDENVSKEFCNYLNDNNILHIEVYSIKRENGEYLARGFDIEEDELYTAAILKYT